MSSKFTTTVNSTSRKKIGEIFEVQLHASVKSNKSTCKKQYECIKRYHRVTERKCLRHLVFWGVNSIEAAHCHAETTVVGRFCQLSVRLILHIIIIAGVSSVKTFLHLSAVYSNMICLIQRARHYRVITIIRGRRAQQLYY